MRRSISRANWWGVVDWRCVEIGCWRSSIDSIYRRSVISIWDINIDWYWCQIAVRRDAVNACLLSALSSIYWGGENDYHVSIRFCQVITDYDSRKDCFLNLVGQTEYFIKDSKTRESICKDMPDQFFIDECKKRLSQDT